MGIQLRELRKAVGISQTELAGAIGSSLRTVGAWERGETEMDAAAICACARALNCTPNDILGWPSEPPQARLSAVARDVARLVDSMDDDGQRAAYGAVAGIQAVYKKAPQHERVAGVA